MNEPERGQLKTEKDALGPPTVKESCPNHEALIEGAAHWMGRAVIAEDRLEALLAAIKPLQHIWTATFALNCSGYDDAVIWEGTALGGTPARIRVDDIRRVIFEAFGKHESTDAPSDEELADRLTAALLYVRWREEVSS